MVPLKQLNVEFSNVHVHAWSINLVPETFRLLSKDS